MACSGQQSVTFGPGSSDVRALQTGPGAVTRAVGAQYSGGSFSLDLNLTDGQAHQVALYMIDWDTFFTRAQTVAVTDAVTGALLNAQPVTDFTNGRWLVLNLKGHVKVTFTNNNPADNAVLSAVMFDPASATPLPPPPTPTPTPNPTPGSATYVKTDSTTAGTWTGAYGSDGYTLLGGGVSALPAYAQVSATGQAFTWTPATTDV